MSLLKVKFRSVFQIQFLKHQLEERHGCRIRPRGRHSNRKAVLGYGWRKHSQNDIPWRLAETVAFYQVNDYKQK
jgi:hypothetical protein